jgi:hypothetical protein
MRITPSGWDFIVGGNFGLTQTTSVIVIATAEVGRVRGTQRIVRDWEIGVGMYASLNSWPDMRWRREVFPVRFDPRMWIESCEDAVDGDVIEICDVKIIGTIRR